MTTTHEPKVWIGCLECYNNGRLVGRWYPANEAGDVTTSKLHGRGIRPETHEELWCMDVENFPEAREMDPAEAQRWGDLYQVVGDTQWPAFCAWVRSGAYVEDGDGMPDQATFEERFCGDWDSFDEYAEQLADDTGLLRDVPEQLQTYFDWSSWTRDLKYDYSVSDAPGGGVFIFRDS